PKIEDIPKPGYSMSKVNFMMTISKEGELLDLTPLGDDNKNWEHMMVPYQKDRTSNIYPYFLCDKTDYVLGWSFSSKEPIIKKKNFLAFKELHHKILDSIESKQSKAILMFLDNWDNE